MIRVIASNGSRQIFIVTDADQPNIGAVTPCYVVNLKTRSVSPETMLGSAAVRVVLKPLEPGESVPVAQIEQLLTEAGIPAA